MRRTATPSTSDLVIGAHRFRVTPWYATSATVQLAPGPTSPPVQAASVRSAVEHLRYLGYRRVVTSALRHDDVLPFVNAGFSVRESLVVLTRELRTDPVHTTTAVPLRLRRARPADEERVLRIDHGSFAESWWMGPDGLRDAITATPSARFRLATVDGTGVGYSIVGRAGRSGYLQRLAVLPEHARQGFGRHLVVDSMKWLRRHRAHQVIVNTQETNTAAIRLYLDLGFTRDVDVLTVLTTDL